MTENRFTVRRTLRLAPEIADRLDRLAAEARESVSAFVSLLVESLDSPRITREAAARELDTARRKALGGSPDRPRGAARRAR